MKKETRKKKKKKREDLLSLVQVCLVLSQELQAVPLALLAAAVRRSRASLYNRASSIRPRPPARHRNDQQQSQRPHAHTYTHTYIHQQINKPSICLRLRSLFSFLFSLLADCGPFSPFLLFTSVSAIRILLWGSVSAFPTAWLYLLRHSTSDIKHRN